MMGYKRDSEEYPVEVEDNEAGEDVEDEDKKTGGLSSLDEWIVQWFSFPH